MSMGQTIRLACCMCVIASAGCVERKFIVESNVPGAQVYIDNKPIGAAPAYTPFEYYGQYTIRLVHPGYETVVKREHIAAPWYAYPPFDFITEALWPFPIRDTRRIHIEMIESRQTRTEDVIMAADQLRLRGLALPPPERPADPRPPRVPSVIQAPVSPLPGATPIPEPAPSPIPSVTPGPSTPTNWRQWP